MFNFTAHLQAFIRGIEVANTVRDGFLAARQADSEGGKNITLNEVKQIAYIALLEIANLVSDKELAEQVKKLQQVDTVNPDKTG